jgi:hypothetical protein
MLMGCSVARGYLLLVPLANVAPPTAVGSFFLLAVLILEGDEHPAFKAGARTLQAGVVGLRRLWSIRRTRCALRRSSRPARVVAPLGKAEARLAREAAPDRTVQVAIHAYEHF